MHTLDDHILPTLICTVLGAALFLDTKILLTPPPYP